MMVSVLMMAATLGLFLWELDRGAGLNTARTMSVSAVVMCEMFYLPNNRYIYRSVLSREGLLENRYVLIVLAACAALQVAYVHIGPLQQVFGSTHLAPAEWLKVLLAWALVFSVAEVEKTVIRFLAGSQGRAPGGSFSSGQGRAGRVR